MSESPASPATLESTARSTRGAGERVGPYLLVRRLGAGGMGEVWLGRRDDGVFDRDVALKLPRLNPLPDDLAHRFERERDILARIEHPNVARLYEAGITADGQPWLAMEYVAGETLTEYADAHRLDVEGRLRLFLQVLAAVQVAHATLVLHRDLKPSNVLVTPEGQVRLLDFGIAKLLGESSLDDTQLTSMSGCPLTPDYASPEHVAGEPLTTASDVYSLGVILFELLAGERPFQRRFSSAARLEDALTTAEVPRPSARIAPGGAELRSTSRTGLVRALSGDLDTVVTKALARRPAERYRGVGELAEDLRRHLAGESVNARRAPAWERIRRFVVRHRWPVAAGATAVVALVSVTAITALQSRRVRAEREHALAEARRAEAVRDFLVELIGSGDPARGGAAAQSLTVAEVLERAAPRIDTALDADPEAKVSAMETLAELYSTLDQTERSLSMLTRALAYLDRTRPGPSALRAELCTQLAGVEVFAGHREAARHWLDLAFPIFATLGDTTSLAYANALVLDGNVSRGGPHPDLPHAIRSMEKAAALYRERYPRSQGRTGALFFLAQSRRALGEYERALADADEAVAIAGQMDIAALEVPNAHSLRAALRDTVGDLRGALDDDARADEGYRKSVGERHFLTLQNASLRAATLLQVGGHREEALRELAATAQALHEVRPGSSTEAQAVMRLADAELAVGRPERALEDHRTARALWRAHHDALVETVATLGEAQALAALGEVDSAQALVAEVVRLREAAPPSTVTPVAGAKLVEGELALLRGELGPARAALERALALTTGASRGDVARAVRAEADLVRVALASAHPDEALAAAGRAAERAAAPAGQQSPAVQAMALEARGRALCATGRGTEGDVALARALELEATVIDPSSTRLAELGLARARCLTSLGRVAEAAPLVEKARVTLGGPRKDGARLRRELHEVEARLASRP